MPLVKDLESITRDVWIAHFNKHAYDGQWICISLMGSRGNKERIIMLVENTSPAQPTMYFKLLPSFATVLQSFEAPILSARLMNLYVGAHIKPHPDYNMGYENGVIRLDILIVTAKEVEFILDSTRLDMQPRECWYTNVNYVHSVYNKSLIDRIHLVIDCKRNHWTDELFINLVSKESLPRPKPIIYDNETIKKMINELKLSNASAGKS